MRKRVIIGVVIFTLFLSCIFCINIYSKNKVAILGYHGILPCKLNKSGDDLIVDLEKFEAQLKLLKRLGYKTMTLDEFNCWKKGKCKKKNKSVLITFDDGYQNNYDYAFELLKKYNMKAVVFSVGAYIESDGNTHMNLKTMNKAKKEYSNIEFAHHTYDLHFRSDKTYEEVDTDIKKMKNLITSSYFAYPFGEYNEEYIQALKDNDYEMAFTFGPDREHRKADINDENYQVPRLNISNSMSTFKFLLRLILPI